MGATHHRLLAACHRTLARLRAWLAPDRLDRDFNEELQPHLDLLTDENVRRGLTPEQARRAASIRLGAPASLEPSIGMCVGCRRRTILQDLRFALRLFAKERWFLAAAIVALALGIGANATGFTIVYAAFLRGLPVSTTRTGST